jgi:hypothetical protein
MVSLLVALAAIALPAVALRAGCVGNSCGEGLGPTARVPFCSLPQGVREEVAAGFRSGRSPDVLAIPREAILFGGWPELANDGEAVTWPAVEGGAPRQVPLVFEGTGVHPAARVPDGTRLDAVAPTLEEVLDFHRPNPGVRSGSPIEGLATGEVPRLVVLVAWKGAGTKELEARPDAWPTLHTLIRHGAGTTRADAGSVPLDPAAILTTIGTGGLPSDHGITGTLLRNDCAACAEAGKLTRAWGRDAPLSIIATLADDFDERLDQEPLVGLVAPDLADRGIVGGTWYLPHDQDEVSIAGSRHVTDAVGRVLDRGLGRDEVPDVLAVVVRDSIPRMDAQLADIIEQANRAAPGSVTYAVTATGTARPESGTETPAVEDVVAAADAAIPGSTPGVEAVVPGGLFLNQNALSEAGVSSQVAVQALGKMKVNGSTVLFADVFPAFAVSFGRYCDG